VNSIRVAPLAAVDPDEARAQAREILESRRFRPAEVPRPLEGVLTWLGDRLRVVGEFFTRLAESWPGRVALAIGLVGVVIALSYFVATLRGARLEHAGPASTGIVEGPVDVAALELDARAAERRGDHELALRLWFRAGLLRLDQAGVLRFRPSLTTGHVAHDLQLADFDELAVSFDAVIYGRRAASAHDVEAARATWPRVVEEAKRR
jgi:hypothetical protein